MIFRVLYEKSIVGVKKRKIKRERDGKSDGRDVPDYFHILPLALPLCSRDCLLCAFCRCSIYTRILILVKDIRMRLCAEDRARERERGHTHEEYVGGFNQVYTRSSNTIINQQNSQLDFV